MGINIIIDAFSGRPDPSWEIDDPNQVRDLLELFDRNRHVLTSVYEGRNGLGYRGVQVHITSDVIPYGLSSRFKVGGGGSPDPLTGADVAEHLLDTMPMGPEWVEAGEDPGGPAYTTEFREWVRGEIRRHAGESLGRTEATGPAESASKEAGAADRYFRDSADYNPGYWNAYGTKQNNNCYNYAVNLATDTFAQPGRHRGYTIPRAVTGVNVAAGALLDGLHEWGDHIPPGKHRYVVALVTGDLGGQRDYHWYRLHWGFWAHKPGRSKVSNTDNSGILIEDPEMCDRDGYKEWCGYMQVDDHTRIR